MTGDLVALFRRLWQSGPPAEQAPIEIPKYGPTVDDLEAIADFISLRLALITPPLFPAPDDTGRAILALGDVAASARAMGDAIVQQGRSAILQWMLLVQIADQWQDHPDYQPKWSTIA